MEPHLAILDRKNSSRPGTNIHQVFTTCSHIKEEIETSSKDNGIQQNQPLRHVVEAPTVNQFGKNIHITRAVCQRRDAGARTQKIT